MRYFLDTNAVLELQGRVLDYSPLLFSDVTLRELEDIKTSRNKDEKIKAAARGSVRLLTGLEDRYEVFVHGDDSMGVLGCAGLPETPDNIICACAKLADDKYRDVVFVTADLCCLLIAKNVFGLNVQRLENPNEDDYKGFQIITMNDEEMAYFYEHALENKYNLYTNEYLLVQNTNGDIIDKYRWTGEKFEIVKVGNLRTDYFGTIKPYNGDIFQQCVLNCFQVNQLSMVKGKAGTGKSYLALSYLMYLLEKHKIDKILVFSNPVNTVNSAKLGYYPGTRLEKQLDSNIGTMLSAKFGGDYALERLVQNEKIALLPMSDIRGFDTTGMRAGVYITEAQNMDITLMKLALQRIGEDSICIIDGDYTTQVDHYSYAGMENGMRRMSEVFRGQPFYGEVELQNIYRSKIAEVAELM